MGPGELSRLAIAHGRSAWRALYRWLAIAGWIALNAGWVIWRALRESDDATSERYYPVYHYWFLAVTGALIACGVLLVSLKGTSGKARWERYWIVVLVGLVCIVCACFEIDDMVIGCRLAYPMDW
jgi:cytochrome bd-type quinol oxidase subunit 2